MVVLKIYYHIICLIKVFFFKLLYTRKFQMSLSSTFRAGFHAVCEDEGHIIIGKNVFFNNYCTVCALNEITIGDGTIFGENVKIYDHNHIYSNPDMLIKHQGYTSAPIHIGKHCWIGSNVTILKGVTIGDNSVIGAGCVVYKDVPEQTVLINRQDIIEKSK